MTTRERILMEALTLFSSYGFDPVSVRDIASAVGIKESSLYNHFKNKQDIFDCLLAEYGERGTEMFRKVQITGDDGRFVVDERTVDMYAGMSAERFAEVTSRVFDHYFTDDINVKMRRLLTIEQYRNPELGRLFRKVSFEDALEFQAGLFAAFMKEGFMMEADPYMVAMAFFSPIFLIFYKYDNDEASLPEARQMFIRHIEHFGRAYGRQPKPDSGPEQEGASR